MVRERIAMVDLPRVMMRQSNAMVKMGDSMVRERGAMIRNGDAMVGFGIELTGMGVVIIRKSAHD